MRASRYMERGRRQSIRGTYQEALDYYQLALDCAEDEFEIAAIHYYMAHALANSGRFEESRIHADKSLEGCDRAARHGTIVQELQQDVRQVLNYINAAEKKDSGSKT
jgi:tetratricopeptide (TPR) repeat protein